MMKNLREYVNDVMNDNRIFSYEDIIGMDNEEGRHYQKAIEEQYGKIGFPTNAELSKSSDVVYVHEYTREDGTVVRAHYRSKAGHRNPDKPVMKPLKEYKTALEKEIDEYMTRDAQTRRGINQTEDNQVDTELKQEPIDSQTKRELKDKEVSTAPLYPSNGRLTGQVEVSHEIPAVNIKPYTTQPVRTSNPYTGREMNMKNVELPEWEPIKNIIPPIREIEESKRMQEQTTGERIGQGVEQLKDKALEYAKKELNKSLYRMITSNPVYNVQKMANKHSIIKNVGYLGLPDAVDTYIGNLTQGKNYEEENDRHPQKLSKIAQVTKVSKLKNKEIKDFIYNTYKRIKPDDPLVVLDSNSDASKRLKKSHGIAVLINKNLKQIYNNECRNKFFGVNFYSDSRLSSAYGLLTVFNPHIDTNNNMVMYAIDYDDYEASGKKSGILEAINDNAYKLQESGIVEPYLKIIEIKITPEELNFIISK